MKKFDGFWFTCVVWLVVFGVVTFIAFEHVVTKSPEYPELHVYTTEPTEEVSEEYLTLVFAEGHDSNWFSGPVAHSYILSDEEYQVEESQKCMIDMFGMNVTEFKSWLEKASAKVAVRAGISRENIVFHDKQYSITQEQWEEAEWNIVRLERASILDNIISYPKAIVVFVYEKIYAFSGNAWYSKILTGVVLVLLFYLLFNVVPKVHHYIKDKKRDKAISIQNKCIEALTATVSEQKLLIEELTKKVESLIGTENTDNTDSEDTEK